MPFKQPKASKGLCHGCLGCPCVRGNVQKRPKRRGSCQARPRFFFFGGRAVRPQWPTAPWGRPVPPQGGGRWGTAGQASTFGSTGTAALPAACWYEARFKFSGHEANQKRVRYPKCCYHSVLTFKYFSWVGCPKRVIAPSTVERLSPARSAGHLFLDSAVVLRHRFRRPVVELPGGYSAVVLFDMSVARAPFPPRESLLGSDEGEEMAEEAEEEEAQDDWEEVDSMFDKRQGLLVALRICGIMTFEFKFRCHQVFAFTSIFYFSKNWSGLLVIENFHMPEYDDVTDRRSWRCNAWWMMMLRPTKTARAWKASGCITTSWLNARRRPLENGVRGNH